MSKAKKFALMGLATGLLEGFDQLIQEAKSERLRQARMAEQAYLRDEARAYDEYRDDKRAEREDARYERSRADQMTDEERAAQREAERYERQTKDRRSETAEERAFRAAEAEKQRQAYSAPGRFKPSYRTVELPPEMGGGWGFADPATGEYATDESGQPMRSAPPYRERQGGKAAEDRPAAQPAAAAPVDDEPPLPGARKASDGNWYVQKNGQYFKVDP